MNRPSASLVADGADDAGERHLVTVSMLTGSGDGRWVIGTAEDTADAPVEDAPGGNAARAVLPGGTIRSDECPATALARHTGLQLGWRLVPVRLLTTVWRPAAPPQPAQLTLIFAGSPIAEEVLLGPPRLASSTGRCPERPRWTWRLSDAGDALAALPVEIATALQSVGWAPPIGYHVVEPITDRPIGDRPVRRASTQQAYAAGTIIDTPSPCCVGRTARLTNRDLRGLVEDPATGIRRRCTGCRAPYLLYLLGNQSSPLGVRWEPQ